MWSVIFDQMARTISGILTQVGTRDAPRDEFVDRILRAARDEFELVGIRRAAMIDIAKRAGVARATLYRRFPDKDSLVETIAAEDLTRTMNLITTEFSADRRPEEAIAEIAVVCFREIREHPILTRVRATEPEMLYGFAAKHGDEVLATLRMMLAGYITNLQDRYETPTRDPQMPAEIFARIVTSMLLNPGGAIPTTDERVRAFALEHLAPIITGHR